jgi:hypothetical protein
MTEAERRAQASEEARDLVAQLRKSNERAAKRGAPEVDESVYRALQAVVTRKLRQRTA